MANFKRVILTEKENSGKSYGSAIEKQMDKFDNAYTSKKLNDLYTEFETISFNNSEVGATIVKNNAVDVRASAKLKTSVYLVTAIIVTLLLAFLAIYNIFVINNLSTNIKLLQGDVVESEANLTQIKNSVGSLTEEELKALILAAFGGDFKDVSGNGSQVVEDIPEIVVNESNVSTNWFDKFCNFLCSLFGG